MGLHGVPSMLCLLCCAEQAVPAVLQYKDRVDMRLIKPAVDWRKAGVADATNKAAVAAQ
jgi:hypothetical protein